MWVLGGRGCLDHVPLIKRLGRFADLHAHTERLAPASVSSPSRLRPVKVTYTYTRAS